MAGSERLRRLTGFNCRVWAKSEEPVLWRTHRNPSSLHSMLNGMAPPCASRSFFLSRCRRLEPSDSHSMTRNGAPGVIPRNGAASPPTASCAQHRSRSDFRGLAGRAAGNEEGRTARELVH